MVDKQAIVDAEGLLRAYRSTIQTTRTTLENDRFYEQSRANLIRVIAKTQRDLAALDDARTNGPSIIRQAQSECKRLVQKIKILKHQKQIEALRALKAEINANTSEVDNE